MTFERYISKNVIETYSGVSVDLLNPDPDTIHFHDISWALARIVRFAGHVNMHYSVAHHLGLCYEIAKVLGYTKNQQRHVLLHDFSEAYTGDCPSPLKSVLPMYSIIENMIMKAIYTRFDVDLPTDSDIEAVEKVDLLALGVERLVLRPMSPNSMQSSWGFPEDFWDQCKDLIPQVGNLSIMDLSFDEACEELLDHSGAYQNRKSL